MVKSSKDKKLILGSALAGLILAGPGLSVTASPTGKFFQTAELKAGYRLAQAADMPAATPKPEAMPKEADKAGSEDKAKKSDQPATSGSTTTPAKSGGEMKCGAGACGGGK